MLVLSVITIPYITKSVESSLSQVPASYREGAEALGIPPVWTLRKIVMKSAVPGIITGLLVAIAISVGETAPLLYTAGWNQAEPVARADSLTRSASSPTRSGAFCDSPDRGLQVLSYDAALLLLVFVLLIIIAGRVIISILPASCRVTQRVMANDGPALAEVGPAVTGRKRISRS